MLKKTINLFSFLGKIFSVIFSLLLIVLVIMAVKLKTSEIRIPCENIGTISILAKEEYLSLDIISTCEMNYIEIKVDNEIDKEKMKVMMLDLTFEIDNFHNVEVLIYNDLECLFGKLIAKGEIIITR